MMPTFHLVRGSRRGGGEDEDACVHWIRFVGVAVRVGYRVASPLWAVARRDERDVSIVVNVRDGQSPGLCRADEKQAAPLQPVDVVDPRSRIELGQSATFVCAV